MNTSATSRTVSGQRLEEVVKCLKSENVAEREAAEPVFRTLVKRDLQAIQRGRYAFYGVVLLSWFFVGVRPHYLSALVLLAAVPIALHQRRIGRRLTRLDTPRVIGPLLDVLATSTNLFRWNEIQRALVRLLPRLQATDAKWLTAAQRTYLLTLLIHDEGWPFYGRL